MKHSLAARGVAEGPLKAFSQLQETPREVSFRGFVNKRKFPLPLLLIAEAGEGARPNYRIVSSPPISPTDLPFSQFVECCSVPVAQPLAHFVPSVGSKPLSFFFSEFYRTASLEP